MNGLDPHFGASIHDQGWHLMTYRKEVKIKCHEFVTQ